LAAIRAAHTIVWAFFVACIVAIPLASWHGYHGTAALLIAIVLAEVAALAFNNWTCPLTLVARRYTDNRNSNFDIYLPEWVAKYNKQIFGPLYVASVVFAIVCWAKGMG
jgi:uncharacterized protein (DUF58 family)